MSCQNRNGVMLVNIFFKIFSQFFKIRVECPFDRGGVEDTRLEDKAKDTKKFRGQGQTLSRPRPRTKNTGVSVLQKKGLQKTFFRRFPLEEDKKRSSQIFPRGFWRFPTKFQRFKNSAVLESRTGQFSRT